MATAPHDPTPTPSEHPSAYDLFASAENAKLLESHARDFEQLSQWRSLESKTDRLYARIECGAYLERYSGYSKGQAEAELIQAWREFLKCEISFLGLKFSLKKTLDADALAHKNAEAWGNMAEEEKAVWVSKSEGEREEALVQYRVEASAWERMRQELQWCCRSSEKEQRRVDEEEDEAAMQMREMEEQEREQQEYYRTLASYY